MTVTIRRLEPDDDRGRFSSGQPDLDRFFHRFAGQNQFHHHVGVTYTAVEDGTILSYITFHCLRSKSTPSPPTAVVGYRVTPCQR